jgi:hypothetical protein
MTTPPSEHLHRRASRVLGTLLLLAIPLSLIHYTDNYLAFDLYPPGSLLGIEVTRDSIWISWLVFVASGVAGYLLYRRRRFATAGVLLAVYSVSGLISIGHYAEPGMSELAWWRHVSIWIDITLGAAVLAFAFWSTAPGPRRRLSAG